MNRCRVKMIWTIAALVCSVQLGLVAILPTWGPTDPSQQSGGNSGWPDLADLTDFEKNAEVKSVGGRIAEEFCGGIPHRPLCGCSFQAWEIRFPHLTCLASRINCAAHLVRGPPV